MEIRRKVAIIFSVLCIMTSATIAPVFSGPPYYHEEGNVNYPGSYFESTYISRGIGVDDYIAIIDLALMTRAAGTFVSQTWGIDWDFYNPDADINSDGLIGLRDMIKVGLNWGLNYHDPPPSAEGGRVKVKVKAIVLERIVHVGEEFTVQIEIKNVDELSVYEAKLSWDPGLIEGVEAVSGDFLPYAGSNFGYFIGPNYIYVGGAMASPDTVSGDGILATVTLRCIGIERPPTTVLDLSSNLYNGTLYTIAHKDSGDSLKQLP